jgi:hypothetical protein
VEYLKYLVSITASHARCRLEIESRIATAKTAFNYEKTLFARKLDLNLRKKLVKFCVLNIALYGTETWTLRKVDQNTSNVCKYGAGEKWRSVGQIM